MASRRVTKVDISLIDLTAKNGRAQMVFRCTEDDKTDIDKAAEMLMISTAQFVRMIVVQAARKVIAEATPT